MAWTPRRHQVLAARFENLREGAKAQVVAQKLAPVASAAADAALRGVLKKAAAAPWPAGLPDTSAWLPRVNADTANVQRTLTGQPAMWITRVSIQNPVFATMMMVALCVLGLFPTPSLGVEQMPDISFPGAWQSRCSTPARAPRRWSARSSSRSWSRP